MPLHHPWDLDARRGPRPPGRAGRRGRHTTPLAAWKTLAAADVSFDRGCDVLYAAVVVVAAETFEVVERVGLVAPADVPLRPRAALVPRGPRAPRGLRPAQDPARRGPLRRPGDRPPPTARDRQPPRPLARPADGRLRQEPALRQVRRARPRSGRPEPAGRQGRGRSAPCSGPGPGSRRCSSRRGTAATSKAPSGSSWRRPGRYRLPDPGPDGPRYVNEVRRAGR